MSDPRAYSRLHCVVSSDLFERKKKIQEILESLGFPPVRVFAGEKIDLQEVEAALQSPTLFEKEVVVLIEKGDRVVGKIKIFHQGMMIVGCDSLDSALPLQEWATIWDLSRSSRKRCSQWALTFFKKEGKKLEVGVMALLEEYLPDDLATWNQEAEKLLAFVGEKSAITQEDVRAIASIYASEVSIWRMAENFVWEMDMPLQDPALFFGLLSSVRQQLMMGAQICALHKAKVPVSFWRVHFPKLGTKLQKRIDKALQLDDSYFQKALHRLFEIEFLAKDGLNSPELLWDWFRIGIYTNRN